MTRTSDISRSRRRQESLPWYYAGIRFQCQSCGRCCGGEPGVVWSSRQEQQAMAEALHIDHREFTRRYLRRVDWRLSLKEEPNGDCILYRDGCSVYAVRPLQCRTFPFWKSLLTRQSVFQEATRRCPGVGMGRLYSNLEIERIASNGDGTGDTHHD